MLYYESKREDMKLSDKFFTYYPAQDLYYCKNCGKTYLRPGKSLTKHAKLHTRGGEYPMTQVTRPKLKNKLTQEDFNEIKAMLNRGLSRLKVKNTTGWSRTVVDNVVYSKDFDEYKKDNKDRKDKYNYNMSKSNGLSHTLPVADIFSATEIPLSIPTVMTNNLEVEIEKLDSLFEAIKQQIINVVEISVNQRMIDYKKQKETEILALQTVVEAAKKSNLVTTLTQRLMGK